MTWREHRVPTAAGPARALRARPRSATTVVLGHGAGGGVESADLQSLAGALVAARIGVVLLDQPWRVAGRRIAPRPAVLDAAWLEAVRALGLGGTVILGGRSAGARVSCRTAPILGAHGVVCLAFPLHPPGRAERSRADELTGTGVPTLVVQGSRDPFGSAAEVRSAAPGVTVHEVPGADHALRMARAVPDRDGLTRAWTERVVAFAHGLGE